MIEKQPRKLRVVWAVDAFADEDKQAISASTRSLRVLARQVPSEVAPVCVMDLGRGGGTKRGSSLMAKAEKTLRRRSKTARLPECAAPRILVTGSPSVSISAEALAAHARAEKADLIVAASHARIGAERLFLGSFSESLILHTRGPLLIVNPGSRPAPRFENLLFPTDFAGDYRRAFRSLLGLARLLKANITILHVVPRPVFETGVYVMDSGPASSENMRRSRLEAARLGEALAAEARRAGVRADVRVETAEDGGIPKTILGAVRRSKAQMIAIAARSGRWRAMLVGSVARQVVRGASRPVLILR